MKAILYAAKSTTDERGSIPAQLAEGRTLAEAEGFELAGEYSDEAMSAFHGDRGPELARAREHAERLAATEGECALIIQHSDRLARGDGVQAAHLVEYALWAIKTGVKIRSIQDPQTFADLLYAVVTGQRNHEDSRRKSLAVKAGHERRARRGQWHGGQRPYGYRIGDAGLVVDEAEAPVIRRIFAEAAAGRAQLAIARGLVADNVPTRRGGTWHAATVRVILRNPTYAGRLPHNETTVEGTHEPIIDEETWQRVQDLAAARARTYGPGRAPAGGHLFRKGMLRCSCGEAMVPRTDAKRSRTAPYEVYRCYGHIRDSEACRLPTLRREQVDTAVYRYFEQVALDVEATRQALVDSRDRKLAEVRALRQEAEHEHRRAEERLTRIRRDYTDGKLDAADWREFRDELGAERDAARAEAERLTASESEVERDTTLADAEQAMLEHLTGIRRAIAGEVTGAGDVDAVRAALARLFEAFVIHHDLPQRVHVELARPGIWIEPIVREQAVTGYSESMRPILRREPLAQVSDTLNTALPIFKEFAGLFGPIAIGGKR